MVGVRYRGEEEEEGIRSRVENCKSEKGNQEGK